MQRHQGDKKKKKQKEDTNTPEDSRTRLSRGERPGTPPEDALVPSPDEGDEQGMAVGSDGVAADEEENSPLRPENRSFAPVTYAEENEPAMSLSPGQPMVPALLRSSCRSKEKGMREKQRVGVCPPATKS